MHYDAAEKQAGELGLLLRHNLGGMSPELLSFGCTAFLNVGRSVGFGKRWIQFVAKQGYMTVIG